MASSSHTFLSDRRTLLALLLLAALLRLLAAHNDLWLDELLSLDIARNSASALDLFTSARVDNNHFLNTLALHFLPRAASPLLVRAPAILWSLASVAAAWWALSGADVPRIPHATRFLFTAFIAFSYPLVHFGSEARGYSGAIFAAILLYGALLRWIAHPSFAWTLLAWIAIGIGLLSHLSFLLVWLPLILYTVLVGRRWLGSLPRLLLLHLPPLIVAGLFGWFCLRGMEILAGPSMSPYTAIVRFYSYVFAVPVNLPWLLAPLLLAILIGLWMARRDRSRIDFFCLGLLILLTPAFLLALRPAFIASRYLIVTTPFLLLLLASLAALPFTRPSAHWLRTVAVLAVLLFLSSNLLNLSRFLSLGRSNFHGLARSLVSHASSPAITLTPQSDFRWSCERPYVERLLPAGYALVPPTSGPPQFFLEHDESLDPPGEAEFTSADGFHFLRIAYFPCAELSGQAFTLYELDNASTRPATTSPAALPVR